MIRGFPAQPSPRAGGTLTLHVSTDTPRFRVELWRWSAQAELLLETGWLPGELAPDHLPFQDWTRPNRDLDGRALAPWPAYEVDLAACPPGAYVAVLVAQGQQPERGGYAPQGQALVAVRPAVGDEARVLYKLPLHTYHAYNLIDGAEFDLGTRTGHWCLYNTDRLRGLDPQPPHSVHLHRPGGGTGGVPFDTLMNFDPYDPTPRQTFVHWDARFLAFLAREGYTVDVCTDHDLHREGRELLAPYRLLLSAGHDEYWSAQLRDAVEGHVAGGGHAAFFSGNTCWWRIEHDTPLSFLRRGQWDEVDRPENALLGASFRNGGERDRNDHPGEVAFRVQSAGHWLYAGTGLADGNEFARGLVGYECDGADVDRAALRAGRAVAPTYADGAPPGLQVLAVADLRAAGWGFGTGVATVTCWTSPAGGTVVHAGTTDWARGLWPEPGDPAVQQVTRNVLGRLG